MEIIKVKIPLEPTTDRGYNSPTYGQSTATTFYINIMLTQNIDDMAMFTDTYYLPNLPNDYTPVDYSPLAAKLLASGITFPFMFNVLPSTSINEGYDIRVTGTTRDNYYDYQSILIQGSAEPRIDELKAYDKNEPYKIGFEINSETYINYTGQTINGVSKIISIEPQVYVFDADKFDPKIGSTDNLEIGEIGQKNGLLFNGNTVSYIGEGWNETNISLSAITKEEYLFGIIYKPEIQNDVFIDRGISVVLEKHLKLSEITNLNELSRYGIGYYNLIKQ